MRVGPYEVLNEIARGGTAAVFRARHVERGHHVALKVLLPESATPARVERLLREGQALARMNHPNLMRCEAHGREGSGAYLALTLVQGTSLQERLGREGPLPVAQALSVALDVGRALAHAHGHGVLHRDLKPDNVLLSGHGRVVLCDFGLLRQDLDSRELTRSGALLGTPGYWPPEQALGQLDRIGPASDVYGWAALLYALLSGRAPREAPSLATALERLEARVPPLRGERKDVPPELDRLLQRALAVDPAERPSLDEALVACQGLRSGGSRTPSRPTAAGVVLAVSSVLALGLGLALWWVARADPEPGVLEDPPQEVAAVEPPRPEAPADRRRAIRALWLRGEVDAALQAAQAWCDAEPESRLARAALATACQQVGDAPRALRMFDALVAEAPDDVDARVGRAQLHTDMGSAAAAEADLERALALDPAHALAHVKRGVLRTLQRRHAEAQADLERAVELDPRSAIARYELARNWHAQGDRSRAIAGYRDAIRVDPEFFPALVNLALALSEDGQLDASREVHERAAELNPRIAIVWFNRGNLELRAGDHPSALAAYDRALALNPGYAKAFVNRGLVHAALGDHAAAIADYDAALRLRPGHGLTHFNRANAKQQLEDYRGAIADCDAALAAEPPEYDAYATRGLCWANLGGLEQAASDYEAFLRLRPNHQTVPDVREWLAEVRAELER